MYVCSCFGMTDRAVAACLADGVRTLEDIALRCGAGSGCGDCHPTLAELLAAAGTPVLVSAHERSVA